MKSLLVLIVGTLMAAPAAKPQSINPQSQIQGQSKNGQKLVSNGTYLRWNSAAIDPTQFSGSDLSAKIAAAFASFGAGKCGTVVIPPGTYTTTSTIYIPDGCTLEGSGRANDSYTYGTQILYNGPAATAAVALMTNSTTRSDFATLRNLSVETNATECTNDGLLTWQAASPDANKWKCYDGASYTSPTPHLAGVIIGNIDPTTDSSGTNIVVSNVDVNGGGQGGDINQQGAFHFGFMVAGCQECTLQSSYALYADDGFLFGASSNGVLGLQLSARLNRRSGIHVRWQNDLTLVAPLMESNQWYGHGIVSPYGRGFLCDSENLASSVCRAVLYGAYFEGNWLDISIPSSASPFRGEIFSGQGGQGFATFSGYVSQARFAGACTFDNGANVTINADSVLEHSCVITTGTPVLGSNAIITQFGLGGSRVGEVKTGYGTYYEDNRPYTATPRWIQTSQGIVDDQAMVLTTDKAATVGTSVTSTGLGFVGRGWKTNATAASQRVAMYLRMNAETGAANPKGWFEFRGKVDGSNDYDIGVPTSTSRLSTSGELEAANYVKPGSFAGAPSTCASGIYGATYFNSTDNRLCVCVNDGTDAAWVKSSDYTHATGHCTP